MDIRDHIRASLRLAHGQIEGAIGECREDIINAALPGAANTIAATYALAVLAEDRIVSILLGSPLLFASSDWPNRTGVPLIDPTLHDQPSFTPEWAGRIEMNLPVFREFAMAVYTSLRSIVDTLPLDGFDRLDPRFRGAFGGAGAVSEVLGGLVVTHACVHAGEINVLNGLHSLPSATR